MSKSFTPFPPANAAAADLSIFDAYAPQSAPAQTQVRLALAAKQLCVPFVSLLAFSHSDAQTGSCKVPGTGVERGKNSLTSHTAPAMFPSVCSPPWRCARVVQTVGKENEKESRSARCRFFFPFSDVEAQMQK